MARGQTGTTRGRGGPGLVDDGAGGGGVTSINGLTGAITLRSPMLSTSGQIIRHDHGNVKTLVDAATITGVDVDINTSFYVNITTASRTMSNPVASIITTPRDGEYIRFLIRQTRPEGAPISIIWSSKYKFVSQGASPGVTVDAFEAAMVASNGGPSSYVEIGFRYDALNDLWYADWLELLGDASPNFKPMINSDPASWDPTLVRYIGVDYDGGNDANLGYVDFPAATDLSGVFNSGNTIKTLEQLRFILPRVGNGRRCVVLIKPRAGGAAYLNKAGAADFLDIGYIGYQYIAFRGSDLSNNTNDRVDMGGRIAEAGPNGDSSWTVSGFGGFTVTTTAIASTEDTIAGLKIQWKGNITAALRARGNTIVAKPSGSTFDLSVALGAGFVPVTNDEFFITRPGVLVTNIVGSPVPSEQSNTGLGPSVIVGGIECSGTTLNRFNADVQQVFVRYAGTLNQIGWSNARTYKLENLTTFILTICGTDCRGAVVGSSSGLNLTGTSSNGIEASAFHAASTFFGLSDGFAIAASYFNNAPLIEFAIGGRRLASGERGMLIGREGSADRHVRAVNGLSLRGFIGNVIGLDVAGAASGIVFAGEGNQASIDDVIGVTSGTLINVSGARSTRLDLGSTITATGTPDLTLAESRTATIASLATEYADVQDGQGNVIAGTGGGIPSPKADFQLFADQLDVPNNGDWAVNATAPTVTKGGTDDDIKVAAFDDTAEEGRGFPIYIPFGATRVRLEFWIAAASAPGVTNNQVGLRWYRKEYQNNTAPTAWSGAVALAVATLANNTNLQRFTESFALSALSLVAGRSYNVEITRNPGVANDVVGDVHLFLFRVLVS